jgi:hypothetical protein
MDVERRKEEIILIFPQGEVKLHVAEAKELVCRLVKLLK